MEQLDLTAKLSVEAKAQLKAIEDAAFSRGKDAGVKESLAAKEEDLKVARAAGAMSERERIRAVEAAGLPGHEAVIAELKYDGKTTGPEAAERVIAAEKTKRERVLANLKNDAPAPVPEAATPPPAQSAEAEANLPFDERMKKQWDGDPNVREEFGDNFKAFLAFSKAEAEGKVRIFSKARQ